MYTTDRGANQELRIFGVNVVIVFVFGRLLIRKLRMLGVSKPSTHFTSGCGVVKPEKLLR